MFAFTKTEQNIVEEVCKGLTNKEIADKLGISVNTVNTYLSSMYKRLNLRNRVELIQLYNS